MVNPRVFISWTGERGRTIARGLHDSLKLVLTDVAPWASTHDISAGRPWFDELRHALDDSVFGIVVLTSESLRSTWVNFEVGYLFERTRGRIAPYLFDVEARELSATPFALLQCCTADAAGTRRLLAAIGAELGEHDGGNRTIERNFGILWPRMAQCLAEARQIGLPPGRDSDIGRLRSLGIGIAVVSKDGCFLMTRRRGSGGARELTWTFPAVMYEPEDRTPDQLEERVVMNVCQETGVSCRAVAHLGSRPSPIRASYKILDYYHCEYLHGELSNLDSNENEEVAWVAAARVDAYVTSPVFEPVRRLIADASKVPGPPVVVGLVLRDGRVLVVERARPHGALTWSLPGGKVRPGETDEAALVREVREETGVDCEVEGQIGERQHPQTSARIRYFRCRYQAGRLRARADDEIRQASWLRPAEFRERITSDLLPQVASALDAVEAQAPSPAGSADQWKRGGHTD